ncbi:hypothetical protein GCM10017668_15080 [Streptomyces tuirus]|uniref:Uncharacterized protein n=1 Tax=Streptomyces tuirus TaxID=68278 RepID=A0A7G1NEX3_9ACTN|nr:hypothetical protein GCM10017668_15080 [Streptomyces tuirus]
MRTDSACAGLVRTIVDAAEHAAATVSAARRADDLLGNGIPSGDVTERRDEGGHVWNDWLSLPVGRMR